MIYLVDLYLKQYKISLLTIKETRTMAKQIRNKKITLNVTENERKFLLEGCAFYTAEGMPMTLSSLLRYLAFSEENKTFSDLHYALGYDGV